MLTATEIMRRYADAPPGTIADFRSSDTKDEFELEVTNHEARWYFSRRDFNFLRPDIFAAGVNFCVVD